MEQLQFIQITPEQLEQSILAGIEEKLNALTENFQPKQPTEWLTRNEVKELLKIDLSTLHNWTKKGKLKAYGIGNRVYYKRYEIEASLIELSK
ncbi:helix-turn-helix domain-containing protein [Carboxylicivirga marina]|uniref:Helix-turn-helix domain-containing protein n=1 Tax=Carboxylicivirga marina TaxID=2800988 RepID=A0ABS1HPX2_9BACT|nr:helix-turn-helix domain-containing protein [Carboxylicivirga marina]MBK3519729.1 helix-turn-helix domain-containing protein [Carboxylicivirga marina]